MTQPLFSSEGPAYYNAAYAHNRPFATGGPYQTVLTPQEEKAFRSWVQTNGVPFDVNASVVDYDMRGFWKTNGGAAWQAGSHFPDTFKTPYDTSFSAESRYALPFCPFRWRGDSLVDLRDGSLVYGTPIAAPRPVPAQPPRRGGGIPASGYGTQWHLEAVRRDGRRRKVQARARSSGRGETHWDVSLQPGEVLEVISHG